MELNGPQLPSADDPRFVPYLLPGDLEVLRRLDPEVEFAAAMVSAAVTTNPRLEPFLEAVRRRSRLLLIDPVTAYFQYEGYMALPDMRALPYSPGQGALGTLWEADTLADAARRRRLVERVLEQQERHGADLLLAPYVLVADGRDPWLGVARQLAEETLAVASGSGSGRPVGLPVMVHLDGLLEPASLEALLEAYAAPEGTLRWVVVVDYDEREATPREVGAVLELYEALAAGGPTLVGFCGRTGLLATARGAAGYVAGLQGNETLPRRVLREGMGTRPANTYYLADLMAHLPVRVADGVLAADPEPIDPCPCPTCEGAGRPGMMVSHRLARHALAHRRREMKWLGSQAVGDRVAALRGRLDGAVAAGDRARELQDPDATPAPLRADHYHYLEVLREHAGGPAATIPGADRPAL